MAFYSDSIKDAALQELINNAEILHICSSEPANYAGIAAVTLGNKTPPSLGAVADGVTNGRRTTVAAITDGSVTGTGTATHWVIADVTGTTLLASGTLSASQAVTNGNTFTLAAFDITFPDAS